MTRDEKIALCRKLKGEGWTVSRISEHTAIARSTVGDYLLGDDHNRQVKFSRGHRCPNCGAPVRKPLDAMCGECIADEAAEKALRAVAMWREGATWKQIADAFGWTQNTLNVTMSRWRAKGYDLPYRYSEQRRENIRRNRWPDEVAA